MRYRVNYIDKLARNPVLAKFFPPDLMTPIEIWHPDQIIEYQNEALNYIIAFAYQNSPYYKEKFSLAGVSDKDFHSCEDLAKFPFLTKDEMRGNPWKLLSVPKRQICQIHISTGTTSKKVGDHIYRLLSWDDIYLNEISIRGVVTPTLPCKPGDVVAIALPYEMSSAGLAIHKTYQYAAKTVPVNVGKGGFYSNPLKTLYAIKDLSAGIIITTPSYALTLWETACNYGITLKDYVHPKMIWLTGEGCSDNLRKRISILWDCETMRFYGSLECGALGAECPMNDGFHIFASHVYIEVVDPISGKNLPEGMLGELCVTVLNKTGQPMIRYRTGDIGIMVNNDCQCCSNFPRVRLQGRKESELELIGGRFSPIFIENLLFDIEGVGNNYQFVVNNKRLTVKVCLQTKQCDKEAMAEKIHRRLECYLGDIESVEIVKDLPVSGGKAKRVEIISQ